MQQGSPQAPAPPPSDEPKEDYLVVPFTVTKDMGTESQEKQLIDLPEPTTLAALYLDVEANRKRRSLLSRDEETVVFLGRVYYPLTIFDWDDGRHLVLDPMGLWEHVFTHQRITDAEVLEELLNSVEGVEDMDESLMGARAALDRTMGVDSVTITGVLFHEGFLNDLLAHLHLVRRRGASKGFINPKLSRETLQESLDKLKEMMDRINEEVAGLGKFSDFVAKKSGEWGQTIDERVLTLREEYEQKIATTKPLVEQAVRDLQAKRAEELASLRMAIKEQERQLARAVAIERQHEAKYTQLKRARSQGPQIEKHRVEIRAAKDQEGVAKRHIAQAEKGIALAERKFKDLEQKQWDRISALSRERAEREAALRAEKAAVIKTAGELLSSVNAHVAAKRQAQDALDSMGVRLPPASRADLVYMQIYVALLEMGGKQRFLVYPPMIARNQKSLFSWLKQLFGATVTPLEPKTREFDKVFKVRLQEALRIEQVFAEEISSAGARNNVLAWVNIGELLADGLDSLKGQGWITDRQWKENRDAVLVLYPPPAATGDASAPGSATPPSGQAPAPASFAAPPPPPEEKDDETKLPPPSQFGIR